ncbi:MAG: hypothetical protein ACYTG0_43545 [Planctomycetota bacterium]|jgi:hypothetical protein
MATTYTLTGTTTMSIQTTHNAVDEMGTTTESKKTQQQTSYSNGYGDNEINMHYRAQLAVTAAHQDLDLYNSLTDVFGRTIIFERIRSLLIKNLSTVDGDNVNFGPDGQANAWTDPFDGDGNGKMRVTAGGAVCLDAPLGVGYEITTTSQFLRIAYDAVSTTVNIQLEIIGVSGTLESSSSSSCSTSSLSSSSQCTSSPSSLSSEKCSESTSSSTQSSLSSISSQG